MAQKLRIVYMGTPEFAVPSLEILLENNYDIIAVITAPDKPSGRGLKVSESPIKKFARANGIKVLQPQKLRNSEFLAELKALNANLQVVVAFRMLPEKVWQMPELGTFNLHGSLLPKYRGAAPIHWAVMNGEKETGLTTFMLKHQIDTGDVMFQSKLKIGENETTGELHDRMMLEGAKLVLKTVQAIENENVKTIPQSHLEGNPSPAPKIFKPDCEINWQKPITEIHNFIRGLSPFPAAWTLLNGKVLKIFICKKEVIEHNFQFGEMIKVDKKSLKIAANGGFLQIESLQIQGKKRLKTPDFLAGFNFQEGIILG